jgi:hypothetical protein
VRCVEIAQAYKEGFFMDKVKSKPGLLNFFHKSLAEIQKYFEHLPNLIEQFPLDDTAARRGRQGFWSPIKEAYSRFGKLVKDLTGTGWRSSWP